MANTDVEIYIDDPEKGFPKIGRPALRALHAAGYTRLTDVVDVSDTELLALHGMGPKALRIMREAIAAQSQHAGDTR